ncbi:GIY-YIG catalytic domain protein [Andreesenia angusta]|uniref:GIY-YIG catalytic domain protein n=1 Tax=Andreesenia angusta TaxID=39480 RepID=A0A1S1VB60_9FIRM|nr:hypothetical protein [Andreesenia angusta]OHW63069.1 GIY-YIG catalytic domain protein [Andreesenia angusta]
MKKIGFIYITTNLIDGKKYIGQRKLSSGWEYYLGSGKLIKRAIKKYGKENFKRDIIEYGASQEELNYLEIKWIEKYNAVNEDTFYNLADGGKSGNKLASMTESEKKAYSQKLSSSIRNSKKHQEALSRIHKSEERNRKLSLLKKGVPLSEKGKASLKTEKRLKACRENAKKASKKNEVPVIQLSLEGEFISEYSSIKEACAAVGVTQLNNSIGKCCKGIYKTGHGFKWKYKNKGEEVNLT